MTFVHGFRGLASQVSTCIRVRVNGLVTSAVFINEWIDRIRVATVAGDAPVAVMYSAHASRTDIVR
ncbi:hypothetical protein GCM10028864_24180 [Microlunatus parietis]